MDEAETVVLTADDVATLTPEVVVTAAPEPEPVVEAIGEPSHVPSKPLVLDGPPSGPAALTAWESLSGTVNTH